MIMKGSERLVHAFGWCDRSVALSPGLPGLGSTRLSRMTIVVMLDRLMLLLRLPPSSPVRSGGDARHNEQDGKRAEQDDVEHGGTSPGGSAPRHHPEEMSEEDGATPSEQHKPRTADSLAKFRHHRDPLVREHPEWNDHELHHLHVTCVGLHGVHGRRAPQVSRTITRG